MTQNFVSVSKNLFLHSLSPFRKFVMPAEEAACRTVAMSRSRWRKSPCPP